MDQTMTQYIDSRIEQYMTILEKKLTQRLDRQGETQDDWLRMELQKLHDEIQNVKSEMEVNYI